MTKSPQMFSIWTQSSKKSTKNHFSQYVVDFVKLGRIFMFFYDFYASSYSFLFGPLQVTRIPYTEKNHKVSYKMYFGK